MGEQSRVSSAAPFAHDAWRATWLALYRALRRVSTASAVSSSGSGADCVGGNGAMCVARPPARADSVTQLSTHLTHFIFDGAQADLIKGLSMDPAFQVTHSFQLASQLAPSNYSLSALFANSKVCCSMLVI